MEDVEKKMKMKMVKVDEIDEEGEDNEGKNVEMKNEKEMIKEVFKDEKGLEKEKIKMGNIGYIWYKVDGVKNERERKIDEVKEKVVEEWKGEEEVKRIKKRMEELKKRVEEGEKIEKID